MEEQQITVEELYQIADDIINESDETKRRIIESNNLIDGIDNIEFIFRLDRIIDFSREIKELIDKENESSEE